MENTILNPPSHLPLHTIPLGRPSATAPSIQYRASNLDWQLVSYMIFYRSNFRYLGQEDPLEKEMASHSSILAWRIPGTGEPGGLPSMKYHV